MAPSHELQKDTDDQDEAGAPKEGAKRKSAAPTKQAGKKPKSEPVSGSRKQLVQPKRWKELKGGEVGEGPVIYWCVVSQLQPQSTPPRSLEQSVSAMLLFAHTGSAHLC